MYYLLSPRDRKVLYQSEKIEELTSLAQELKVDGTIAEELFSFEHSGKEISDENIQQH